MNNPAQISSSSDSEICATTNPLASRAFRSPPDALPVSSFNTPTGASREARSAGKIPKITPVSTEITIVASNTVRSARMVSESGISGEFGRKSHQCSRSPHGDQQRHHASRQRQHQAFHQQLPHQPPPARAQRHANGHFTPPPHRPHQHQIRHVRACQQQHQARDAHQRRQQESTRKDSSQMDCATADTP